MVVILYILRTLYIVLGCFGLPICNVARYLHPWLPIRTGWVAFQRLWHGYARHQRVL